MKQIKPVSLPSTKDVLFNREKIKKTYFDLSFAKAMLDFYMNTKVIYEKIKARRVDDDFHLIRNSVSAMAKTYEKAIAMTKLRRGMALQLPGFRLSDIKTPGLMFQITQPGTFQIQIPPEAERVYFLGITAGGSGGAGGAGGGGGGGGSGSGGNGSSAAYGGGGGASGSSGAGGGGGSSGQVFFFYVPVSQLPSYTLTITNGAGGAYAPVTFYNGPSNPYTPGGSGGASVGENTNGNNGTAGADGPNGANGNNGGTTTISAGNTIIAQLSGGIAGLGGQGGQGGGPGQGATTTAPGAGGTAPTTVPQGGLGGGQPGTGTPSFTFASFVRLILPVPNGNPIFAPGQNGGNGQPGQNGSAGSGSTGGNGGGNATGGQGGNAGILFGGYIAGQLGQGGGGAGSGGSSAAGSSGGAGYIGNAPIPSGWYGAGSIGGQGGGSGAGGGGGGSSATEGYAGGNGGQGSVGANSLDAGDGYILIWVI